MRTNWSRFGVFISSALRSRSCTKEQHCDLFVPAANPVSSPALVMVPCLAELSVVYQTVFGSMGPSLFMFRGIQYYWVGLVDWVGEPNIFSSNAVKKFKCVFLHLIGKLRSFPGVPVSFLIFVFS